MNELNLIHAIYNDDKKAFNTFFKLYYARINAYAFSFVHDNQKANDLAQQSFVKLWEQRKKLNKVTSPKNYIFRIAYNLYVDDYRKLQKEQIFLDELKEKSLRDQILHNDELTQIRIEKLKKVIDTLPKRCKEVLLLNKMEGLKYKEIAEQLDISIHTVNAQMQTAFIKIRDAFGNDESLFILILKTKKLNF